MEITEVRIKLTADTDDRLQAFCSITFDDCFVVRDLKIIEGTNGPFVAMPSRKLTTHCSKCGCKNHLRANYCNQCGAKQHAERASRDQDGRAKLYADIAHPINSECREIIQEHVITEYRSEMELAKQPGYKSRYEDDYDDDFVPADSETLTQPTPQPEPEREKPVADRTDIQPAASEPRPPHSAKSRKAAGKPGTPHQKRNHAFGAGIFDE